MTYCGTSTNSGETATEDATFIPMFPSVNMFLLSFYCRVFHGVTLLFLFHLLLTDKKHISMTRLLYISGRKMMLDLSLSLYLCS